MLRLSKTRIRLEGLEASALRLLSKFDQGGVVGAEPSMLKLQGSQLVQAFDELLMEVIGEYALPEPAELEATMKKDDEFHTGHFYNSPRHTIQVDFNAYCADLKKEIQKGTLRASKNGNALPVRPRAFEAA